MFKYPRRKKKKTQPREGNGAQEVTLKVLNINPKIGIAE